MDQERALEKIKKCLEMAKGKSSNPNEAETALRQAHKMMEAFNLEVGDVLASMASEVSIKAGSEGDPPAWRVELAYVCAHAFGTRMIITAVQADIFNWVGGFLFVGCGAAPELTGYAYQVLERQLQKARREYLQLPNNKRCKRTTKVSRGDQFATGWIRAVYHKVDEFAGVDDNIADAIQAFMDKNHPNLGKHKMKRRKTKGRDVGATDAGYRAGKSAQLHTAVNAGAQPLRIGSMS
ncbi:DUF2786 domain-containing protein [uncultured Halopseudomonas sp.]|uniref:DUF2786 domain-containing protein n=1 Tax=uncultured Halopseudomonas sp. TaxID=2901193 RepID=UPI0030ED47C4|tara:strand:+ start:14799 stop:15509 length:711 start_codon:yes stop_codon:yes gene_type:complete